MTDLLTRQQAADGLTVQEYAASRGVAYGTLKRWIHEGLPVRRRSKQLGRTGSTVRVNPATADEWIARHRAGTIAHRRESVVYFAQHDDGGPIKVGFTSDVERRRGELVRSKNRRDPAPVYILGSLPGAKPLELEIHDLLAPWRIEGEWYEPTADVLRIIYAVLEAA